MKELRLLLSKKCNRKCKGCCNKDWDLDNLPVCKSFKNYKTVMLTGGEPMLDWIKVIDTAITIRDQNPTAKIYMYTAKTNDWVLSYVLHFLDGITITLHEQSDILPFLLFNERVHNIFKNKSLRLNIFEGVDFSSESLFAWDVRKNITWIKNCPLPKHEVFMKL